MEITQIIADIVCTEYPLHAGTIMYMVHNHPHYKPTGKGLDRDVNPALETLVERGVLAVTDINMSKHYHANLTNQAQAKQEVVAVAGESLLAEPVTLKNVDMKKPHRRPAWLRPIKDH